MRLKGSYFRLWRIKKAARSEGPGNTAGFTLLEVLITLVIGALVMIGLSRVVGQSLHIHDTSRERQELTRQARFAMARMTRAIFTRAAAGKSAPSRQGSTCPDLRSFPGGCWDVV